MFELSAFFESQTTTIASLIFFIGSIIFYVLFDTTLILIWNSSHLRSMPRATQIQIVVALGMAAAFLAAGVVVGASPLVYHRKNSANAAPGNILLIEMSQRQFGMQPPVP